MTHTWKVAFCFVSLPVRSTQGGKQGDIRNPINKPKNCIESGIQRRSRTVHQERWLSARLKNKKQKQVPRAQRTLEYSHGLSSVLMFTVTGRTSGSPRAETEEWSCSVITSISFSERTGKKSYRVNTNRHDFDSWPTQMLQVLSLTFFCISTCLSSDFPALHVAFLNSRSPFGSRMQLLSGFWRF